MLKALKIIGKICRVCCIVVGVLFVIYFWNLDQKLMEWAYRRVNEIFDRKKENISF